MANPYYTPTTNPADFSARSSSVIRSEFLQVELGFDKLPALSGQLNKLIVVPFSESRLDPSTGALDLSGTMTFSGGYEVALSMLQGSRTLTLPSADGTLTYDSLFPGVINGLLIGNATDTVNDIIVTRGSCTIRPATIQRVITMPLAGMTKQLDAVWAKGNAQGGRCPSLALADGTWHVFVMLLIDGDTDVIFDTSSNGTNILIDFSTTLFRRIGSILRAAAAGGIVPFIQTGNLFTLTTPTQDVSTANPGTGAVTATLGVPTGIQVEARVSALVSDQTSSVDKTLSVRPTISSASSSPILLNPANGGAKMETSLLTDILTNTSAQITYQVSVSDADISVKLSSHGWTDYRGQYDSP